MSKERICGIYKIVNELNNKMYIGQSINIYERWRHHKIQLRHDKHHNSHLQNAWNKYGEQNFQFVIIEECSESVLDVREIYYITKYNTFVHSKNAKGYNLSIGGEGIGIFTDEMRQIFREAQRANPIYQIDLDGNIINVWHYGAREASKKLNISQACIWHCINHDRRTYKNYIWIYVDEYEYFKISDYVNQNTQAKSILQYDMYGNFIKKWDSANQTHTYGFDPSAIVKVCKQKYSSHRRYIWCYEDDVYIKTEI